uniref:Solute carrier family 35 member F4 n=5 Tax=Aphidini TaxID=33387 RepID=A0A2S2NYB3_SCHGA
MDAGITNKKKTMTGVLLAALAAAGSAVYKVMFKKMIGDATYGQVSLFFSLIGLLNAALLWPVCLVLYFSEVEILHWDRLPWMILLSASTLSLVANLLGNLSVAFTYDIFITFGLITAVPVSAAIDITIHDVQFYGMKLAGIILISIGFLLVMFPNNWPEYIFRLLRNIILLSHSAR